MIFPPEILLHIHKFTGAATESGYFTRQKLEKALGWSITELKLRFCDIETLWDYFNRKMELKIIYGFPFSLDTIMSGRCICLKINDKVDHIIVQSDEETTTIIRKNLNSHSHVLHILHRILDNGESITHNSKTFEVFL